MKTCTKCKEEKENSAYAKGDNNTCKPCHNIYAKQHYLKNKDKYYLNSRKGKSKRRQERREWLNSIKNKPCIDCGGEYHPQVMEFDHIKGEKKENIAIMFNRFYSKEAILEEIAKCELVCANCHRLRTILRYNNMETWPDA